MGEWSILAVPAVLGGVSLFAAAMAHVESRMFRQGR